jgi:isoleucyl-tRNA synthetase
VFKEVTQELNFPEMERRILKFWEDGRHFEKLRLKLRDSPKRFAFLDGPITANNPMGVHHAWGRTYKDLFQRYKARQGFDQRFQNGFDCQGLWVEVEVERELGFGSRRDIEKFGIGRFIELCQQRVHKYSMVQTRQSIRLGQWMDWGDWETEIGDPEWLRKSHSYYTMSEQNNYAIWHFLRECHRKGWIYKGHDVMPWCARCGTALSEHEIATEGYQELTHRSVTLRFPLQGRDREYLLVWTTTPWTLTSNVAVAVHPDLTYVKVEQDGRRYYLAKGTLGTLRGPYGALEEVTGEKLVGMTYRGPFDELPAQSDIQHRVIPWRDVSEVEGTGLVHIAPGCGREDFALSKEHGLAVVAPLDESGFYVDGFDWLTGMDSRDVAEAIFEDLEGKGLVYRIEDYTHRYPVCWRCDSGLIFRLVDEWFISMGELRHQIMESARQVRWIPPFGLERELDWLRNMEDWCISKKRYWGLALPIWVCECGAFEVIGSRSELEERAVSGWAQFEGHTPHRPWIDEVKIACTRCGQAAWRIADVGNPWLDAGIVPFSTLGYLEDRAAWQQWFPFDFITECFPGQFRNWFYAILAMSTVLERCAPFRTLLGHALVKDEHGQDMHKSKGNAIWAEEAAEKMGADVMRWVFCSQNPVQNLNFGFTVGEETKRRLLTLHNVYSFFVTYARIDGFDPRGERVPLARRGLLDRWIISRLQSLIRLYRERLDDYDPQAVTREAEVFLEDLSTWYVRRSRRRFWKSGEDQDKLAAHQTLYECLTSLVSLLAPFMPFWMEEIYQNLVRGVDVSAPESVHLGALPVEDPGPIDQELEGEMALCRRIASMGRAARMRAGIKVRQPLSELLVKLPAAAPLDALSRTEGLLRDELNVKIVRPVDSMRDVVSYRLKPRFDRLGPRFGSRGQEIAARVSSAGEVAREAMLSTGRLHLRVDDEDVVLTGEEVEVVRDERPGYTVETEPDLAVALSTALTRELENEGFARELVNKIQYMRKEARFGVPDRIAVFYRVSGRLAEALDAYRDYVFRETLAVSLEEGPGEGEIARDWIVNGQPAWISLRRISAGEKRGDSA